MKRWTWRILLCLFLGAVTTVAVAWVLSVRHPLLHITEMNWSGQPPSVDLNAPPEPGTYLKQVYLGRGPDWKSLWRAHLHHAPVDLDRHDRFNVHIVDLMQYGWPVVAMQSIQVQADPMVPGAFTVPRVIDQADGLRPPRWIIETTGFSRMYLPSRPIWPGFLIDTFLYGAVWIGPFLGFSACRRLIRRLRGRCPRCGYDLRGHAHHAECRATEILGCPECGWNRDGVTAV